MTSFIGFFKCLTCAFHFTIGCRMIEWRQTQANTIAATNWPLSATISSSKPHVINRPHKALIVALALVKDIQTTSIHLDLASTTIRNIPPLNDPANSTCKSCPRRVGQIHGMLCNSWLDNQSNLLWSVWCHCPGLATKHTVTPETSFASFLVQTALPVDIYRVSLLL